MHKLKTTYAKNKGLSCVMHNTEIHSELYLAALLCMGTAHAMKASIDACALLCKFLSGALYAARCVCTTGHQKHQSARLTVNNVASNS